MSKSSISTRTIAGLLLTSCFVPAAFAGNQSSHTTYGGAPDLVPNGANAGECFARVKVPAQYSTTTESILVEEGYTSVDVSQAQLTSRQQQVMTKEASVRYEVKQPTFRTVSEKMMVRPSYDKLSVSAPTSSIVTETVQVSAPRVVWKRGNPGALAKQGYTILSVADAGIRGKGYKSTGHYGAVQENRDQCGSACEIWCLVQEPGETMSYNRKVTQAGRVTRSTVPAKYKHISKQVVSDPGGVREIPVPAQYRSITVEEIVSPGGERTVDVPPKYGNIEKKVLVSPERYEWRRVICAPPRGGYSSGASYGSSGTGHSSSITYGSTGTGYTAGSTSSSHSGGSYAHGGATTTSYGTGSSSHNSITYGGKTAGGYHGSTVTSGHSSGSTTSNISWAKAVSVINSGAIESAYINDGGMMASRNDPRRRNAEIKMVLKNGSQFTTIEPYNGAFQAMVDDCTSCSRIAIAVH